MRPSVSSPFTLRSAILLAVAFAGSGCALIMGGRWHDSDVTRLHELSKRTQEVVLEAGSGRQSLAQTRLFLEQSIAQVDVLIAHEQRSRRRLALLRGIRDQFHKILARGTPLRKSDGNALMASFGEFAIWDPDHGRKSVSSTESTTSTSSTDDTTTTDTTTEEKEKDKDKEKKRDRDDCKDRDRDHHRDRR
jgi:hypothetical protein